MTKISDEVDYVSIYFVQGESPAGWTRNAIKDPPSGGWGNAFVIRREGYQPKIFVPYTIQGWPVRPDCYELERTRDPIKPLDVEWMKDCLIRSYHTRLKVPGSEIDKESAAMIFKAMDAEVPEIFFTEFKEKAKPVKPEKVKSVVRQAREGLISVASIAEELKIVPRVARGYLRALKIDKPTHGWAGNQAWADDIKSQLQAEMSKDKPTKATKPKIEDAPKPKAKQPAPKPAKKLPTSRKAPPAAKKGAKKVTGKTPTTKKVVAKNVTKPAKKLNKTKTPEKKKGKVR